MWYYSVDGQTLGPLSEAELDQQVRSGALPATVYIWRDGMTEWQPYNEVRTAGRSPLRVAVPTHAVTAPAYAEPEPEAEPMEQGGTRLESISSWGMMAVVLVSMFLFIGMLASRSHGEGRSYGSSASAGESLHAKVMLRQGSLTVSNGATFDWPLTIILLKSGSETYLYKLSDLPQQEAIAIPLGDFAKADGEKFDQETSGTMDFMIAAKGYASARFRVTKR